MISSPETFIQSIIEQLHFAEASIWQTIGLIVLAIVASLVLVDALYRLVKVCQRTFTTPTENKVMVKYAFIQEDFNGLVRGQYVQHTKPTPMHKHAAALLRHDTPEPMVFVQPVGDTIVAAQPPSNVGCYHPDAPELKGPFIINAFDHDIDRLSDGVSIKWVLIPQWPTATLRLIIDDRLTAQTLLTIQCHSLEKLVEQACAERLSFLHRKEHYVIASTLNESFDQQRNALIKTLAQSNSK